MAEASTAILHGWHHADTDEAKREILAGCGDLSKTRIRDDHILAGIYMRPAITRGGLLITRGTQREDVYQGKVSLVLAIGPAVFRRRDPDIFIGDWIVAPPRACEPVSIRGPGAKIAADRAESGWLSEEGWPCCWVFEKDIFMVVERPEWIV
jgi:hypothetical protein